MIIIINGPRLKAKYYHWFVCIESRKKMVNRYAFHHTHTQQWTTVLGSNPIQPVSHFEGKKRLTRIIFYL